MALEDRIARLEALEAIRSLVDRMRRASDNKNDPAIVREIFAEDCEWRTKGGARLLGEDVVFTGRDALVKGASEIAEAVILQSWHHFSPVEVALAPDLKSAEARWYLFEILKQHGTIPGEYVTNVMGGWYDGQLIATDDGWKIQDLTLDMKFNGPAPEAWLYP